MTSRWQGCLGAGYIVLCSLLTFNVVLVAGPVNANGLLAESGRPGFVLLFVAGLLMFALALKTGLTLLQWQLVGALSAWILAPALSMVFLGSLGDVRFWWSGFATVAVAFAAVLMSQEGLRRLLFGFGWFYGWGSVIAGVSQVLFGWPRVLVGGQQRFESWLAIVGIQVDDVASLNGLTPGRLFLAMNCGVLLAYSVRRIGWPAPLRRWLMPLGLAIALAWSFGRVGMLAAVLGLAGALVPWERWRPLWPFLVAVALSVAPLVTSRFVSLQPGTTQWRFDLWETYFDSPMWGPFGIGPQAPPDPIRGHAHNQFLETLATGGWLAIVGLLGFLYLAFVAGLRCSDRRATVAVIFSLVGIFVSDVVTFAPAFTVLNSALVMAIAVIANAAGSPPHSRLLGETPDPINRESQHGSPP